MYSLFKLYKNEEVNPFDYLKLGYKNFKKSWAIALYILLKMLLPFILIIISYIILAFGVTTNSFGIISIIGHIMIIASYIWIIPISYSYQLTYVIAFDDTEISSADAVSKSKEMMKGNRFKFFCLQLSFIGWCILAAFTIGIGYLWLLPYMQFATIIFYYYLKENNETPILENSNLDNNDLNNNI